MTQFQVISLQHGLYH